MCVNVHEGSHFISICDAQNRKGPKGYFHESHFKDLNTCFFGVPSLSVLVLVSFESDTSHDVRNVLVNLENARRSSLPLVLFS